MRDSEQQQKTYQCECGQIFDNPQKFNAHKSWCRIHLGDEKYNQRLNLQKQFAEIGKENAQIQHEESLTRKKEELEQWISEQHTCEKCGKIMTEKYGSGRFCSKSCSCKHNRTEQSIYLLKEKLATKNLISYELHPNQCVICGAKLSYDDRYKKTCSDECRFKLISLKISQRTSQSNSPSSKYGYKYGNYRGIFCDSSWELAFVIWCIDHELNIERNIDWFEYDYEGKRLYSPDFKIDGIYFEIKNFYSDKMKSKIQQFPQNKTLVIIDSSKIKPYIEYAITTYGNEFIRLYDRHYSSWMDQE